MKLVFCKECQDIVRPRIDKKRECECGKVSVIGRGETNIHITGKESAYVFGFCNSNFVNALRNRPKDGMGFDFNAFVIPEKCQTVIYED